MADPGAAIYALPGQPGQQLHRLRSRIRQWAEDLLDAAHPLLDVAQAAPLVRILEPSPDLVLNRLGDAGGWRFHHSHPHPGHLLTDRSDEEALDRALSALERQGRAASGRLHLVAGVLHWPGPERRGNLHSPLLLVPVRLDRSGGAYRLLAAEQPALLNPLLAAWLPATFGIELPEPVHVPGPLPGTLWEALRSAIHRQPGWRLDAGLALAAIEVGRAAVYRDLAENEDPAIASRLVQALVLGAEAGLGFDFRPLPVERLDPEGIPERTACVLEADAGQLRCVHAAGEGRSFVIDGPPGTGKSQTVANIAAHLVGLGRTVLVVSERPAALDAVRDRLAGAGLEDCLLPLADVPSAERLARQLLADLVSPPPSEKAVTADGRLAELRRELTEYADALHEPRPPLGWSLHRALTRIQELEDAPTVPPPRRQGQLDSDALARILEHARSLARAWGPVERVDSPWRGLRADEQGIALVEAVRQDLEAAEQALEALWGAVREAARATGLDWTEGLEEAERLRDLLAMLPGHPPIPPAWLVDRPWQLLREEARGGRERLAAVERAAATLEARGLAGWRHLAGRDRIALQQAEAALGALPVPWPLHPQVTVHDLAPVAAFLTAAAGELAALQPELERAVAAFGLDARGVSLERFEQVTELARLMASPTRPEANWLEAGRIQELERAADELEFLLAEYDRWSRRLSGVFAEQVLGLDLPAMWARLQSNRGPLARLSGSHHQDLRMLAACSRQGKATREVIERIPEAMEWQRAGRALDDFGYRRGELIGEHYFWREHTDLGTLRQAIEVARRVVALAGDRSGTPELRSLLARDGSPDPALAVSVEELAVRVRSWQDRAGEALGEWARDLARVAVRDLTESCAWALQPITTVHAVLERASQVAGRALTLEETRASLADRVGVEEAEAAFLEGSATRARLFGDLYRDELTDWDALEAAIDWAEALSGRLGPVSEATARSLLAATLGPDRLITAIAGWARIRSRLAARFPPPRAAELERELAGGFTAAAELLDRLRRAVPDTEEWATFTLHRRALEAEGLGAAVERCLQLRLPRDQVAPALERAVLEQWAEVLVDSDARLARLRSTDRDRAVQEFCALDRDLIAQAPAKVLEAAAGMRPRPAAEVQAALREGQREADVRDLMVRAGHLVQRLRPCFLATPAAVARWLPPDLRFDAVLLDEASRLHPGEAVTCIYRGDQMVVAGDLRQAPPAASEPAESILDVCRASGTFPTLTLDCHYRSWHPSLVAYVAASFYGDRLTAFPAPLREDRELGVHVYRVPGTFRPREQDNPEEARMVAQRLIELARARPRSSLGVVALTDAQAEAVEEEVLGLLRDRPDLEASLGPRLRAALFASPGEAQGEERDVVLLSLTYGPDAEGRMPADFGWLTRSGGERLLNVALTRARRRVEVFATISPADLPAETIPGSGLWHLRRYLEAAGRPSQPEPLEPFAAAVARTIEKWGYRAAAAGSAGLGVSRPGDRHFLLGVQWDGSAYHDLRVARDRDRLRAEVLRTRGWRLHRLWQPAWWYDRETEKERLRRALEEAAAAGRPDPWLEASPPVLEAPAVRRPLPGPRRADEPPRTRGWTAPYRRSRPEPVQRSWDMGAPEAGPDLRRMIVEVVELEGPVHQELVLERVRQAWSATRLTEARRYNFSLQVRRLQREGALEEAEGFLRTVGQRVEVVRTPDPADPETRRPPSLVPPEELDLALDRLAAEIGAAGEEKLVELTAEIFGWGQPGPEVRAALEPALERLSARGRPAEGVEVLDPIPNDIHRCLTPQGYEAFLRARAMLQERLARSGSLDAAIIQERLAAIDRVLAEARVLPPPASTERVALGTLVSLARPGRPEEVYQVVGPLEAEAGAGKLNVLTPLGVAVWQRRAGESVTVQEPEPYEVTIAAIDRP